VGLDDEDLMVNVIFHWSPSSLISGYVEGREILRRYDMVCLGYEVDDCTFITEGEDFPRKHDPDIDTAMLRWPGCTKVYVHHTGAVELTEFAAPENVVFIFGPDYEHTTVPEGEIGVRVGSMGTHDVCFADQVAAVVLHEQHRED